MRLLAPASLAMRSTRAPPRPWRANSTVAAARMRSRFLTGSRRVPLRGTAGGAASVELRTDVLRDAADPRHFVGEQPAELLWRARRGVGAEGQKTLLHLGKRQRLDGLGVEPLNDLARRACRREERLPRGDGKAGKRTFAERRQFWRHG